MPWSRLSFGFLVSSLVACSSSTSPSNGDGGPSDGGLPDTYSVVDGAPVTDRDAAEDDKDGGGSCTGSDGISFGTEVCNNCMDAHCCTSVDACYRKPDCSDLSDCLDLCVGDAGGDAGGASCRSKCRSDHSASVADYDAVVGCLNASCGTECK